jgi:hypothetical protein
LVALKVENYRKINLFYSFTNITIKKIRKCKCLFLDIACVFLADSYDFNDKFTVKEI